MRILILTLIFFSCAGSFPVRASQDIVLKTRFDLASSEAFIEQLRLFLKNNEFGDPYRQELKKPLVFDLKRALEQVPEDTQDWIRKLQSVLRIEVFQSDYKITIHHFSYSVNEFNSAFRTGLSSQQRIDYVTESYVKGLQLAADKVVFSVELQSTQNQKPITFDIEMVGVEFLVRPELVAELSLGWSTAVMPQWVLLGLETVNIEKLMTEITSRPELIDLRVQDLNIPDVSFRIGSRTVRFDEDKIKGFFVRRKEAMKKGILDLLKLRLRDRFANILEAPKRIQLPKQYSFAGDLNGVWDLSAMSVNRTGIVELDLDGHFCPAHEQKFCVSSKIPAKLRRAIDPSLYQKSLREINRILIEKQTNIALSVSEDYLNQLIEATLRAGLIDEALKGQDFILGTEKVFVLAEEKGELFSLYLDVIHRLKGAQRILVGRSEIRFPVKLMIGLRIEEVGEIPHLRLEVKEVATTEEQIISGIPQYGLPTTVTQVRFRGKVVSSILSDVSKMQGLRLLDIPLEELKGTYLDELEFASDGQGRATALIGFHKREKP